MKPKLVVVALLAASCGKPQTPLAGRGLLDSYSVDCGLVDVGSQSQQAVTFSNDSDVDIHFTSIDAPTDGEFAVATTAGTVVPARGSLKAEVTFAPQSAGPKSGAIVLHTDDPGVATVTLSATGEGVLHACQVTPTMLDFGTVGVGNTATTAITLTNASDVDCVFTPSPAQGAQAPLFAIDQSTPITVHAGDSASVGVTYAPKVSSSKDLAYMIFEVGESDLVEVDFQGAAVQACLGFTPDPLEFAFVPPGHSASLTLSLTNLCSEVISVASTSIVNPNIPPAFSIASTSWSGGVTLQPGVRLDLVVTFAPQGSGPFAGELDVSSTASTALQAVALVGYGGGAVMQCWPQMIDFQTVATGIGSTLPLICANTGTDVPGLPEAGLSIPGLMLDNVAFTATVDAASAPQPLSAGQSLQIDVSFLPAMAGPETGTLQILSDAVGESPVAVPLTGEGIVEPGPCVYSVAPSAVDFGQIVPGGVEAGGFVLADLGPNECLVTGLEIGTNSDTAFGLPDGPLVSQRLSAPGSGGAFPTSIFVPLTFSPPQTGDYSGSVHFSISDPAAPQQTVTLSASAGNECFVLQPANLLFDTVGTTNGQLCASNTLGVTGFNGCAQTVTVESVSVSEGAPFTVVSGSTSQTVAAGMTSSPIELSFQPTSPGSYSGVLLAQTDLLAAPLGVGMTGAALAGNRQTDLFWGPSSQLNLSGLPDPSSIQLFLDGPPPDETPDGGTPGVVIPSSNPNNSTNWAYQSDINAIVLNAALFSLSSSDTVYVTYLLVCP